MAKVFNIEYIEAMHGSPRKPIKHECKTCSSFSAALRHARKVKKVMMLERNLKDMKTGRVQFTFKGSVSED